MTATANEANTATVANPPAKAFGSGFPAIGLRKPLMRKPTSGNSGISQA